MALLLCLLGTAGPLAAQDPLTDTNWKLQSIDGAPFAANATLEFRGKSEVGGRAPCNRFFGTRDKPFPSFSTGPLGATKMMCPDDAAEIQFFQALAGMTRAEVVGDILTLSGPKGQNMVFTASE